MTKAIITEAGAARMDSSHRAGETVEFNATDVHGLCAAHVYQDGEQVGQLLSFHGPDRSLDLVDEDES